MSATATRELRRVEAVMGTTVSIDIQPPLVAEAVLDEVVERLHDADARFSTYRADSEVSRLADGALLEADASADLRHVLAACDHLAVTTDGHTSVAALGNRGGGHAPANRVERQVGHVHGHRRVLGRPD